MTKLQDRMYWNRWAAVVRANRWRMVKGRLDPDALLAGSQPLESVVTAALRLALQQHRSPTVSDIRHGCHVVALGRDKSHADFSNREFDRLLTYWGDGKTIVGLLLEPEDLGSEIHRANPDLKTRERHLHFLRHDCLGGYVASECARLYGTKHWEALSTANLIKLSNHLRARPNALKSTVCSPQSTLPDSSAVHSPAFTPAGEADPDWSV